MGTTMNRKQYYWIFQLFGWTVYSFLYLVFTLTQPETSFLEYVSLYLYILVGFLLTHGLRWYIKKSRWIDFGLLKLGLSIIAASFIVGSIYSATYFAQLGFFFPEKTTEVYKPVVLIVGTINICIVIFIWQILYFGAHYVMSLKSFEVEKWRFEAEAKEAQLNSLKSQLNPHFIFNSLNSVRALILIDPVLAQEMITKLSNMMRYTLQSHNKELVSFEDEMMIVDDYLNLEKIRFEDRLTIEQHIDSNTLTAKVPPMIVQTLVENAIKHGISNLVKGGNLVIKAQILDKNLHISIQNPGILSENSNKLESTKTGIKNSTDRIKLLFGNKGSLTIENTDNQTVTAALIIPQEA